MGALPAIKITVPVGVLPPAAAVIVAATRVVPEDAMVDGLAETVMGVEVEDATFTATHAEAPVGLLAAVYVAVMVLDPGDRFVPITVSTAVPTAPDIGYRGSSQRNASI